MKNIIIVFVSSDCNIKAEGFRFHAFGSSSAEHLSAQHMGYLGATLAQVFIRGSARRANVSLRDVTIARDGKRRLASANDVTQRKHAEDLGRFWKSQRVETWLGRRRLAFACSWRPLWRVPHEMLGGYWKARIERLFLLLLMSKNL